MSEDLEGPPYEANLCVACLQLVDDSEVEYVPEEEYPFHKGCAELAYVVPVVGKILFKWRRCIKVLKEAGEIP